MLITARWDLWGTFEMFRDINILHNNDARTVYHLVITTHMLSGRADILDCTFIL